MAPARRGHPVRAGRRSTTTTRSSGCARPSRSSTRRAARAATTRSTCRSRRARSPSCASSSRSSGCPQPQDGTVAPRRHREAVRARPGQRARAQRRSSRSVFRPDDVFRIDHYLGKETVQNLLALRFANQLFEPIWNANYVDHVQITMAEDIGIGGRAGYYDGIGAARDVIQNHLLQLLALTAMEEPVSFERRRAARREDQGALARSACPATSASTPPAASTRPGWQGGEKVVGYLEEEGFDPESTTETFAAIRVDIDNRRWAGRAVLPAHRQAPGPPRHRDRRGVQARAAPAVRVDRRPRSWARTPWSSACSPTRASRCGSAPRCRAPPWRSAT